ncbi:hypothetical protein GCM10027275_41820 [Rhabdobacter roseus]|uniref:Uncharacterized protein n=1 Tax=Rhabdobacter roseus TaxID=1655419 RepID=A0A840U200_9BACT|nr:hypothetical protein [Rhabdobacter roseus]MBB5286160.1 hypothetical protein [Rhabdobacter roseus]
MAFSFDIPLTSSADTFLDQAQKKIEEAKGAFHRSGTGGSFKVPAGVSDVEGSFLVEQGSLRVTIAKKPFYATENMIKEVMKRHLPS